MLPAAVPVRPCIPLLQLFFEPFLPRDRLSKRLQQFAGLRDLLDSRDPEPIVLGYETVLELNPAITPAMVEKMLTNRCVGLHNLDSIESTLRCSVLLWPVKPVGTLCAMERGGLFSQ